MSESLDQTLRRAAATPRLDERTAQAEVAARGRKRRRQRLSGLAAVPLLAVLSVAGLAALAPGPGGIDLRSPGDGDEPSVLALPPEGETAAAELEDGSPVFVVHHDDGDVDVLSAVSTHLEHLVIWCAPERLFIEPVGASLFSDGGTWLDGPAPHGLAAYETEEVERDGQRFVDVGALGDPPARPSDTGQAGGSAAECFDRTVIDDPADLTEAGPGSLLPTPFSRQPLRPDQLDEVAEGQRVVVEATLDLDREPARLCEAGSDGCADDGVPVTSTWWHSDELLPGLHGATQGRFLVSVGDGQAHELAQLRREIAHPRDRYLKDLERDGADE